MGAVGVVHELAPPHSAQLALAHQASYAASNVQTLRAHRRAKTAAAIGTVAGCEVGVECLTKHALDVI